ncbi:antibiotic biosynthesis monooxygenase family protein [Winogradskyella luteola]|uniref:Antibiotic biosynthesis monooxygenase n=1 Tax=Winogradskyella luteola TaxID=2828330 RepID=A0A9X1F8B9_9FLAO|nr:antibiotic biosynthesis monooxygenase [Winogradskyella luteola]MBV7268956.1 antibiotic biosynthesis monooxygenase [Winogradskyella luteola]
MKENVPYYAVIFTSTQTEETEGYTEMANKMEALAKQQKGYLDIDSARNNTSTALSASLGITVSYWESLEAIKNWKANTEHLFAQQKGREQWYNWYNVRICKVEREYEFKLD